MNDYSKVLVPLDFHTDNDQIIARAKKVADHNGAELYLLHVDESVAELYLFEAASFSDQLREFKQKLHEKSLERLSVLAKDLNLDAGHQLVCEGKAPKEIEKAVKDLGIDLIVMGSHGHSGWERLLGTTTSTVLNNVGCDVLTVRMGNNK